MPDVKVDLIVEGSPTLPSPVNYELVYDHRYEPEATEYTGKAEVCTIFFDGLPEQIPLLDTLTEAIAKAVGEKVAQQNEGQLLELKIFRATGEWYNSKWKVEITLHASPFPWAIVVPLIVVLLIVVGLAFLSYEVKETDWAGKAVIGAGIGLALVVFVLLFASMTGKGKSKEKGVSESA